MATVYERICKYEVNSKFRFNYRGRLNVGAEVAKAWREHSETYLIAPEFKSVEPHGTFQVPDYPDTFTERIDEIIYYYVVKITTHKKYKKTNEKPTPKVLSKTNNSVPPDTPKRKRKPIPYYSTRKK